MKKLTKESKQDIADYQNLATLQNPVLGDSSLNRLLGMVAEVQGEEWLED
jgi:hypothetical protein